jgi:4-hydroxy-3-methylbut-2-enyl diphosphate reductase IspH
MKIILADHFGMCFGVRDAIAQAMDLAEQGRSQFSASSSITQSCANGFERKACKKLRSMR